MQIKKNLWVRFTLLALGWLGAAPVAASASPIIYQETLTRILTESQVQGWPVGYETHWRYVDGLTNSADGKKIAFKVHVPLLDPPATHVYVMNTDGTGLKDLTGSVPSGVDPNTLHFLQLTGDGSVLFYNAPAIGGNTDIYYITTATGGNGKAVKPASGTGMAIHDFDFRKPFTLQESGGVVTLYFRHNAGLDPKIPKVYQGLYSAGVGNVPTQVIDLDLLPGDKILGNFKLLGSGGGQHFFIWNKDIYHSPATSMYKYPGLNRVPDEVHNYVWPQSSLPQKIVSANGGKVLYQPYDMVNDNNLYLVDTSAGTRKLIAENKDGLNHYFFAALSPQGTIALFQANGFRGTRAHLATGDLRDTLSCLFKEWYCFPRYNVSDITRDDRYYFLAGRCDDSFAKMFRIDLKPTDYSKNPDIKEIWFSAPFLVQDNKTFITVMARVSDAQGLGNIHSVTMTTMVGGLEFPEWLNATPLNFWPILYDDGTHGDALAGDGIFTNNTLRTQVSNFYQRYPAPSQVGIRIAARDKDDNYTLADTTLALTARGAMNVAPVLPLILLD